MNILFFVLSFLFGLLVYGDTRPSDKCVILHSNRVNFAIQCSSRHDNATTLIEALNSKANESVVSLSIAGVGIDEIPNNLSDLLPNVTTLKLKNAPSKEYEICTNIFKNIEVLELINMNISEMKFTTPHPNLIELTIVGGEMTKLDKSFGTNLPNLESLSITSSKLSSLGAIKKICSLRILNLRENKITSLDIDNATRFPYLMVLDLDGNAIESVAIDHSALPELINLYIDFHGDLNQLITGLNLPELKELMVRKSNSKILNVPNLENLPKLKDLHFEEGKLESVPIGNKQTNATISFLSLANNNISIVNESDFEGWTNLRILHLNQNNIKKNNSISESYNDTFLGLPSPTSVFLGGNPITSGRGE
ncbi:hypothetical protein ACOME3_001486 [Neoechinorhynchus agilis]